MPHPTLKPIHEKFGEHSKLFRDLLLGFVRVHILHHASRGPVYGVGVLAELQKHGYDLSPGTLYPVLHSLEAAGFLDRDERIVNGKIRKYYEISPLGQRALDAARQVALELAGEIRPPAAPTTEAEPRLMPAPARALRS